MAINQLDLRESFGNALAQAAYTQRLQNMLAPGASGALPEPVYNALEQNGGPTRAASNALSDDWARGRVEGVDPRLVNLLDAVRAETGVDFIITEGMRDKARQQEMVNSGKSQTMNSRHLHGNAIDIAIQNPDGSINWDFDAYVPLGEAFKRIATEKGLTDAVWGGDWKTLRDGVHFQLG